MVSSPILPPAAVKASPTGASRHATTKSLIPVMVRENAVSARGRSGEELVSLFEDNWLGAFP